jgi:hypothetical protein
MLIQKPVRHDSIIASQRLVVEFCNTIHPKADQAEPMRMTQVRHGRLQTFAAQTICFFLAKA